MVLSIHAPDSSAKAKPARNTGILDALPPGLNRLAGGAIRLASCGAGEFANAPAKTQFV